MKKLIFFLFILMSVSLFAQQQGAPTQTPVTQDTIAERMSNIMPPVLSTAVIKDIYADKAKLDITFEWMRYNPRFTREIEENETEIRRIILYVLDPMLYYSMRYNEARVRKELIDALNSYFQHGQIDNLRLSGWPPY